MSGIVRGSWGIKNRECTQFCKIVRGVLVFFCLGVVHEGVDFSQLATRARDWTDPEISEFGLISSTPIGRRDFRGPIVALANTRITGSRKFRRAITGISTDLID